MGGDSIPAMQEKNGAARKRRHRLSTVEEIASLTLARRILCGDAT
jgi:hypothetical protein